MKTAVLALALAGAWLIASTLSRPLANIAAAAGHSMPVPQPGPRVGSATVPL